MELTQVRLPKGLVKEVNTLVKERLYTTKSDLIRDAVRRFVIDRKLEAQIGSIPNTGDSVKEIREIRRKLSKGINSYEDFKRSLRE